MVPKIFLRFERCSTFLENLAAEVEEARRNKKALCTPGLSKTITPIFSPFVCFVNVIFYHDVRIHACSRMRAILANLVFEQTHAQRSPFNTTLALTDEALGQEKF